MKTKWYEESPGNTSMLRVMLMPVLIVGLVVVLSGTVAMFLNNPYSVGAIGAGSGIVSIGLASKAWSKVSEKHS